ncbi:unnamed protein product, partial [Oppiella nova]
IHIKLDLSSLQSIRAFVQQIYENETKIDILVNNAGIAFIPELKTADGFEMAFGTNHLGHYLLTLQLLPLLRKAPKARVINVASLIYALGSIHFENIHLGNGAYDEQKAYCQSKLANILFTRELAKRLTNDTTVTVYALSPGMVNTDFSRHMNGLKKVVSKFLSNTISINVEKGCQTTLYCALEESLDSESGFYYEFVFLLI